MLYQSTGELSSNGPIETKTEVVSVEISKPGNFFVVVEKLDHVHGMSRVIEIQVKSRVLNPGKVRVLPLFVTF
jgi:hypothetical protein